MTSKTSKTTSARFSMHKIIFVLLCFWCLLPIAAWTVGLFGAYTVTSEILLDYYLSSGYQNLFFYTGTATLLVLMIYFVKISFTPAFSFSKVTFYFARNIWMLFYLLLLLWIVFSAFHAPSLIDAFAGARYRDMGVFTYLIFGCLLFCPQFISDEKTQLFIFRLFLLAADFTAVFMLVQELDIPFLNSAFGMLRSSVFIHFNHMGYYLNLACICASGLFIFEKEKSRLHEYFSLCSLLLLFYTLLINDTMGGILACLLTSIVLLWFYYLRNHRLSLQQFVPAILIGILVLSSCAGLISGSSGGDMADNFLGLYADAGKLAANEDIGSIGTLRFSLWQYYGKMIPKHPFLGLGPDQEPAGYEAYVISDRPANEYLYHAVFHGLPSLVFYLGFLTSLAFYQLKHIKELSIPAIIAAGCVITYCISAFFGNAVYYTTCYLFLFLGFVIPASQQSQHSVK